MFAGNFYRGVVGKSYYAMFHATTAVLLARGIERSSHQGIIAAFGQFLTKPGVIKSEYHQHLCEAFSDRNRCDYLADSSVDKKQAQISMQRAQEFISVCKKVI